MLKVLLRLFYWTGKDAPVYADLAVLAVITIIGLTIYHVLVLRQPFDVENFGLGVAGPLGGHAAGSWADGQGNSK